LGSRDSGLAKAGCALKGDVMRIGPWPDRMVRQPEVEIESRIPNLQSRLSNHTAAVITISIFHSGLASLACTVARAGVLPGQTQASQTLFISANSARSVM